MSLTDLLARRIAITGPITIGEYMAAALGHPAHGYYATRDPLGAAGDFITAPEISQMFGELLGLWLADCWIRLGRPDPVLLVELGPGRGTLMADALRAMATVPGLRSAARLHLIETSPTLRSLQARTLSDAEPRWHDRMADLPTGPLLLVANEFFDALPIRQFEWTKDGWRERLVAWEAAAGRFRFVRSPRPDPIAATIPSSLIEPTAGVVVELCPPAWSIAAEIGRRLADSDGAALVVDYGYTRWAIGDTLQAVRRHRPVDPLDAPGTADLTAHVNFAALVDAAAQAGARTTPIVTQAAFLGALGIETRAGMLRRQATPVQARDVDAALERLIAPAQMGELFKVVAFHGHGAWTPAGF